MEGICLQGLEKSYGGRTVLHQLSAVFPAGAVTCITAPSGGGKTTLLRILMGLESADSGTITGLDDLKQSAVFQEDRLCEHLTPVSNIRLVRPALSSASVLDAMQAVGLSGCEKQPVRELSGGMRRRVAILRALLADYDILFLDEPFKGLDHDTREKVISFTRARCAGRTVLLVTHDRSEAEALGAQTYLELSRASIPDKASGSTLT